MAWYHVNGCDCPIGSCDCGTPRVKQEIKGKDMSHLDAIDFQMVKDGICPGCFSTENNCICGEID